MNFIFSNLRYFVFIIFVIEFLICLYYNNPLVFIYFLCVFGNGLYLMKYEK